MSDNVVRNGKYVSISHTIVDEAGQVVEQHDLPVGYVHGGAPQLLGDMDKAIAGHRVGEQVQLTVPPEQAFGQRNEKLIFTDDIENAPPAFRRIGAEVQMQNDQGDMHNFYVTAVDDRTLTVGGNHPLAGQALKVMVKIHQIRDAHAVNVPASSNTLN